MKGHRWLTGASGSKRLLQKNAWEGLGTGRGRQAYVDGCLGSTTSALKIGSIFSRSDA